MMGYFVQDHGLTYSFRHDHDLNIVMILGYFVLEYSLGFEIMMDNFVLDHWFSIDLIMDRFV